MIIVSSIFNHMICFTKYKFEFTFWIYSSRKIKHYMSEIKICFNTPDNFTDTLSSTAIKKNRTKQFSRVSFGNSLPRPTSW